MHAWNSIARGMGYGFLVLTLAAGAFWAGSQLTAARSVAYAEPAGVSVSDRAAEINGQPVGEVLINGTVVIRLRTETGGCTAHERAMIVADRIQRWLSGPYSPYDLAVREGARGDAELRAAGQLLVTANADEAAALGSSAMGLAQAWRDNIMMALGVGGEAPGLAAAAGGEWTPSEPYGDKIVPIISILEGTRIGGARVNGPLSKLDQVHAVAQLETHFRDFLEIDIYVPITTNRPGPGGLDRVQQVGVTALGDINIDL